MAKSTRPGMFLGLLLLVSLGACTTLEPFDCASDPGSPQGLVKVKDAVPGRYIVVMKPPAPGVAAPAIESFANRFAVQNVIAFASIGGLAATMDLVTAPSIARDPQVAFVQEDGIKSVTPVAGDEGVASWGLDRCDQR